MTHRLLREWEGMYDGETPPHVHDFLRVRNEWFDEHAFLLKSDPEAEYSAFILCGRNTSEFFGRRPAGMAVVDAVPDWLLAPLVEACDRCIGSETPQEAEGRWGASSAEGRFRSIILPLSNAQHPAAYLLGALSLGQTGE